jgi:hypothetical protein
MTENEETPQAITGVVQPPPLAKLCELLGIEIVDVERFEGTKFRSWYLTVKRGQGEHRRTQRLPALRTADFKNARTLNWMAWQCGRSDELPRLTRADGMRALRLMHEYVEANGRVTGTSKSGVVYGAMLRYIESKDCAS